MLTRRIQKVINYVFIRNLRIFHANVFHNFATPQTVATQFNNRYMFNYGARLYLISVHKISWTWLRMICKNLTWGREKGNQISWTSNRPIIASCFVMSPVNCEQFKGSTHLGHCPANLVNSEWFNLTKVVVLIVWHLSSICHLWFSSNETFIARESNFHVCDI